MRRIGRIAVYMLIAVVLTSSFCIGVLAKSQEACGWTGIRPGIIMLYGPQDGEGESE